ncbi:MAG: HTH domain-containing protein [Petrotogales bacterium]
MTKKTTSYKILKRREQVKMLMARGITEKKIADKLGVSRKTISRDKEKIREELTDLFENDEEATSRILEMLDTQFKSILQEYWKDRHKEGSKSALGGIRQTVNDYISNLQSLGFVKRVPDTQEITVENVDSRIDDIIQLSRRIQHKDESE